MRMASAECALFGKPQRHAWHAGAIMARRGAVRHPAGSQVACACHMAWCTLFVVATNTGTTCTPARGLNLARPPPSSCACRKRAAHAAVIDGDGGGKFAAKFGVHQRRRPSCRFCSSRKRRSLHPRHPCRRFRRSPSPLPPSTRRAGEHKIKNSITYSRTRMELGDGRMACQDRVKSAEVPCRPTPARSASIGRKHSRSHRFLCKYRRYAQPSGCMLHIEWQCGLLYGVCPREGAAVRAALLQRHVQVACRMLHVTCCMSPVACCMPHAACHMLHVTCCMSHVARHMLHAV